MSKKSKANLPAGGFVALGRDGGSSYEIGRGKAAKREMPPVYVETFISFSSSR